VIAEDHRDTGICVSIVWIHMLEEDTEMAADRSAREIFHHPLVRHFYDPHKRAGQAIAQSLGGQEDEVAWDIYLFYDAGSAWDETPPTPTAWMHQCTGCHWADPAHHQYGDDLVQELRKTMLKLTEFKFHDPGRLVDGDLELVLVEKDPGDPAAGHVPAYRFSMRRAGREEEIGGITLRVGNTHHVVAYAGHIGYGVHAEHRGHRYAARACRLLLPLARSHGLHTLWITCKPDNAASRRTCEIIGAELVEIVDLPEDTDMYQRGERQKCRYRLDL